MNDHPDFPAPPPVRQARTRALVAGLAGLALLAIGAVIDPRQFFFSYLVGFLFVLGLSLGSLALALVQYLTGGVWGLISRRVFEAASRTLPLVLILFVPILFGVKELYPWARPEVVAADELLQSKQLYLNLPFFFVRAAIYWVVWLALAYFVNTWSSAHERTGDVSYLRRLQRIGAAGVILYVLTMSFAAIDWLMSLEPHWFSSIFGLLVVTGQGLSGIAFAIATLVLLSGHAPYSEILTRKSLPDLGNLMLAFVMLWAYMSFSQFLIIWSGNLPEEIIFYVHRLSGGWQYVGLALVAFHFALPFLVLLMRAVKLRPLALGAVAILVLVMRVVDLLWIAAPQAHEGHFGLHWLDVVAPAGLFGIWLSAFLWQYASRPVLPIRDPDLAAAFARH